LLAVHSTIKAMNLVLARLSDSLASATSLRGLTVPLLELLETVTGFESTYLTAIDFEHDVQEVQLARNTSALTIPEGLVVPWGDTLCKRALDEGRPFADDVAACWGDSGAAKELGIRSYASAPVMAEGAVCGTLCAASKSRLSLSDEAKSTLQLFARLIGRQIERERLLGRLTKANIELSALASTDALTGLPNRRLLMEELRRVLARGEREGSLVLVAMIDLDNFKSINDTHGHEAGDAFLAAIGQRLQTALRATDLLGRLGGDEFVAVGPGPAASQDVAGASQSWCQRLAASTRGRVAIGATSLDYAGASVGVAAILPGQADADEALRRADAAMYAAKQRRRSPPPTA
jgi:diguanylate cyclase